MIHVRAWKGVSTRDADVMDIPPEDPSLQITITTREDLEKFYHLLQRSLNCAPEFGKDYFELSDKLEAFLKTL